MESSQNIPLWGYAPYVFDPQSNWAIWLLRTMFYFVSLMVRFVAWTTLSAWLPDQKPQDEFDLEIEEVVGKGEGGAR